MKMAFALGFFVMFASPVFAQNQKALGAAGCGTDKVKFDVETDKKQRDIAQPEPGKALVYVFEDERYPEKYLQGSFPVTTKIGVDGQWVGANYGDAYFSFTVDPGDHNVCAKWQSSWRALSKLGATVSLSAEAGQVYYFRTEVDEDPYDLRIEEVAADEGKRLAASSSFSTSHPKK